MRAEDRDHQRGEYALALLVAGAGEVALQVFVTGDPARKHLGSRFGRVAGEGHRGHLFARKHAWLVHTRGLGDGSWLSLGCVPAGPLVCPGSGG